MSRRTDSLALLIWVQLLRWEARLTDLSEWSVPPRRKGWGGRTLRRLLRLRSTPLWSSRSVDRRRLIGLGMYVLRDGGIALVRSTCRCLPVLQKLQAGLDMNVGRV